MSEIAQVGGTHYGVGYQHWDLMDQYKVAYLEACATKYLDRWEKKGGIQDLEKSLSYIRKRIASFMHKEEPVAGMDELIGLTCGSPMHRTFHIPPLVLVRYIQNAKLGQHEQWATMLILSWEKESDLHEAIATIEQLIKETQAVEATNGKSNR